MKIEVNLFASLARFKPKNVGKDPWIIDCKEGTTVAELLKEIIDPEKNIKLVFVNNTQAQDGTILKDEDKVGVFPPIGGG